MKKIATPTAVNGEFVNGNRETGRKATQFSAEWCNDIQNEIWNLICGLKGSDPTGESQDEALKAVNRHIVEYLTQENLTSARIFEVLEAGKLPVLQIGGGGASGYTKMYAYPCTFEKNNDGYRRAVFFRLSRGEVNNVVSNVLYWYEYVNIPTNGQGEGSSNGSFNIDSPKLKSLGVVGNAEVGGNIVADGTLRGSSVLAEDGGEFAIIDNGGHPVGKARTNCMPDALSSASSVLVPPTDTDLSFMVMDSGNELYEGEDFIVYNNRNDNQSLQIKYHVAYYDTSESKWKPVVDSGEPSGYKLRTVSIEPYSYRRFVYLGCNVDYEGVYVGCFMVSAV